MKKTKKVPQKSRGFLLTFLLVYVLVGDLIGIPAALLFPDYFTSLLTFLHPVSVVLLFVGLAALEAYFIFAVLMWKKRGVYGFLAVRSVLLIVNLIALLQWKAELRVMGLISFAVVLPLSLLAMKLVFDKREYFGKGSEIKVSYLLGQQMLKKSKNRMQNYVVRNKRYVVFSLIVGVLGFLATLASVTEGGRQLLFFFVVVPFAVAVATGARYERSRYLWGPLIVYSTLFSAIVAAGVFYGVKFFGYGALAAVLLSAAMLPLFAAPVAVILFAPSWVFFALIGKRSAHAKEWLVKNRRYLLFSLAAAAAGLIAATVSFALTKGVWKMFFAVFAATLIISVMTAMRYSRVKMLLGPVAAASLASTVAFVFMSFGYGSSSFGPGIQDIGLQALLIELPLLFAAVVVIGFVLSALLYAVAKAVLKKAGRRPRQ